MRKFNRFQQTLAWVLSFLVILQFSGCWTVKQIPRSQLGYSEKTYYFIHGQNSSYQITNTTLSEGILSGKVTSLTEAPEKGKAIHIYVAPDSAVRVNGDVITVSSANIAKMEIDDIDVGRTIFAVAGVASAAFMIVVIIAWLTKEMSCPFVYSETGTDLSMEGEIYSGATAVPIERDDYLRLKSIKPLDEMYSIRITNEVKEIQNTNLAELLVFDHPRDVEVLVDKYGVTHSVRDIRQPASASYAYGRSLTGELSGCDNKRYFSEIRNDDLLLDTINLSFDRPQNSSRAKLVISAKNTMWLDYMFGRLSDMFGSRYDEWVRIRNKRSREYLQQWSLDQGIPLAVYLETASGFEFVDYFNVPGPARDKRDILDIDLSGVTGDRVNVKLVSGVMFWDFDYAGMDFSEDIKLTRTSVPVDNAADETGKEVASLLLRDDDRYLVQPDLNNEARLNFKVPPQAPGTERSVFLHSKGNYQPVRAAGGKPDMDLLVNMRRPGMFIRFTKDHFLKYYSDRN